MVDKTKIKQTYDFNVSTWVTYDVKKKLYELANRNKVTVSHIVREIIEKGVDEYGRE